MKKLNDTQKQNIARRMVIQEILHIVNQTINMLHKNEEYPEFEAKNYDINNEDETEPEIFEYWAVSDWLGEKLKENKEIVFECLDFVVWGRQTTGQAILLDNVIQKIAIEAGFNE